MDNKKTLLVIIPERGSGDGVYYLIVAETGEGLASHLCSASHFAIGDLYANRPERKEEFGKRFGEIEVKYIDETNISLDDLLERNKKFHEEHKEQQNK